MTSSSTKASASIHDNNDKQQWLASQDTDPFDIAVVYDSLINSNGNDPQCGHKLLLDPLVRSLESSSNKTTTSCCPVCQQPILLICDGSVSATPLPVITFKYGKQIYRLTIPDKPRAPATSSSSSSLWGWIVSFLIPFFQSPTHSPEMKTTAQYRIASALGVNVDQGLKILHKGKVLHPPPSSPHKTTTTTTPYPSPTDLSNQLLEISRLDWTTTNQKASLFVMATRNESQVMARRPNENIWQWKWNQLLLYLPWYILQTSLGVCRHFVRSIFRPLDHHSHQD
jgi:hypothetical protein